ncbi:MAG: pantetheine-phosphate adenylyltransferase [Muribaculaceae bacterium]|nr:pantetheine-phosphate adenylyltransferase [Muribaculaceae bacterium]
MSNKSAFFAGSFNPFTVGHLSVVERALTLFDRVVIGIGINSEKESSPATEEQASLLRQYFRNRPEVEIRVYTGLTADEARAAGCTHLLRSVRSVADFEYERNLADANRNIFGMETFILYTEPQFSFVSSSLVRELRHHGIDPSRFLPEYK